MEAGSKNNEEQISRENYDTYQEHKSLSKIKEGMSELEDANPDHIKHYEDKYEENIEKHKGRGENMEILRKIAREEMKNEVWEKDMSELSNIQKDIISKVRQKDTEEIEKLLAQYDEKVLEKQEKLYSEHKKENSELINLDEEIEETEKKRESFKRSDLRKYKKIQTKVEELLEKRSKVIGVNEEEGDMGRAREFSQEHLDTLEPLARREMEEELGIQPEPEEENNTPNENNQPQEAENNNEQQPNQPEQETRSRLKTLYRIVAGVAGFGTGALVGSALVSSSLIWFPIIVVGTIGFAPRVEGAVNKLISKRFFNPTERSQLEQRIQNATAEERPELERELARRKKSLKNFQDASASFFRGGAWGLVLGSTTGFAPSGDITPGMYTDGIVR